MIKEMEGDVRYGEPIREQSACMNRIESCTSDQKPGFGLALAYDDVIVVDV